MLVDEITILIIDTPMACPNWIQEVFKDRIRLDLFLTPTAIPEFNCKPINHPLAIQIKIRNRFKINEDLVRKMVIDNMICKAVA